MKKFPRIITILLAPLFLILPWKSRAEVTAPVIEKITKAMPTETQAKPKQARKVLVFSKTNGFRHGSIPTGIKALELMGEKTGAFTVVATEDESAFSAENLKQFDGIIFLNTTNEVLRPKEWPEGEAGEKAKALEVQYKQNLVDFVKSGKGLMGIHAATDTYKKWKEFNDMMGGAFAGHPWHMPVPVKNLLPENPVNWAFSKGNFEVTDEIYQFREGTAEPGDREYLLTLDPAWDGIKKGNRKDKRYPISWIDSYGEGRVFYCSLGHRDEIYWNPVILKHYLAGIQYALGDLSLGK